VTYSTEKRAYGLMSDLQGICVPKILGDVVLDQPYALRELEDGEEADEMDERITPIPGLLMQYVEGFHLTDLHKHLPSKHWQSILDSAVQTIGKIQDSGILNDDVNTRSFIVDPTHHVVMIDYGLVRFREDFKTQRDWARSQASYDEEGAVGSVMPFYLKRDTGIIMYHDHSDYARRLDWRFNREEGEHEGGDEEEDEYVRQDILWEREAGILSA
jgi:serine/threonine protein kinase